MRSFFYIFSIVVLFTFYNSHAMSPEGEQKLVLSAELLEDIAWPGNNVPSQILCHAAPILAKMVLWNVRYWRCEAAKQPDPQAFLWHQIYRACTCIGKEEEAPNLLKVLLLAGLDPNYLLQNYEQPIPILQIFAASSSRDPKEHAVILQCAQILLDFEADPYVQGAGNTIAVHHAAAGGHPELIRILIINKRQDKDARDADGNTPLHNAAQCEKVEGVRALLALNANPNLRNNEGQLPIDMTQNEEIRRLLIATNEIHALLGARHPIHGAASPANNLPNLALQKIYGFLQELEYNNCSF